MALRRSRVVGTDSRQLLVLHVSSDNQEHEQRSGEDYPSVPTHQNNSAAGAVLARKVYLPLYIRLIAARSACRGWDETLRAPVGARVRAAQRTGRIKDKRTGTARPFPLWRAACVAVHRSNIRGSENCNSCGAALPKMGAKGRLSFYICFLCPGTFYRLVTLKTSRHA
jgi:hypothetical protein